jgi:hypothetical protein
MTGTETEPIEFYTVEAAAYATGRSDQNIRRYIRNGIVDSIKDPTDGRRRLIPMMELTKIIQQPKRGYRLKAVKITMSNGTVITRILPIRKED